MAVPAHLRYSPVNHLIVDWGFNAQAFNDCGLPQPRCWDDIPDTQGPAPRCNPLPIREAIDTYDWERWLPEIIVGIDEADEEIAASYAREAAIIFCRDARVLQREIIIEWQPDEHVYPVFPYQGERIVGVLRAARDTHGCMTCSCGPRDGHGTRNDLFGLHYSLDTARNEITLQAIGPCTVGERVRLLVWSTPTEDACEHDVFIYEHYRRPIAQWARRNYARAVHFRDQLLMRSLPPETKFEEEITKAKRRAHSVPSAWRERSTGSGMWQTGCWTRRGW